MVTRDFPRVGWLLLETPDASCRTTADRGPSLRCGCPCPCPQLPQPRDVRNVLRTLCTLQAADVALLGAGRSGHPPGCSHRDGQPGQAGRHLAAGLTLGCVEASKSLGSPPPPPPLLFPPRLRVDSLTVRPHWLLHIFQSPSFLLASLMGALEAGVPWRTSEAGRPPCLCL